MKTQFKSLAVLFLAITALLSSCQKDTLTDAEQLAALKDVGFTFQSMNANLSLPTGALGGQTFDQLMAADSSTFGNAENYSVSFLVKMLANNTKENAKDAKFDGMSINMIMDTLESAPITTAANGFEILKNTTQEVIAQGNIKLSTHKPAVLYIFKQMADGQDLTTTLSTYLNYNIGSLNGAIALPSFQQQIPTSASAETKSFLTGLLNSGVFQ
jgi:hypothetical protein